jgi:hypothetical protein
MRAPFDEYLNFLLFSVFAAAAVFAVLALYTAAAALILGIAVLIGANVLWFYNNRLDKYEDFIPTVLSIYHTAIFEDQLSHEPALARIAEYGYPESEIMQKRLLKDAKELDDLWPQLRPQKLAQFVDRDTRYLELTREEQEMIFLVYLIYCKERGIVPTRTGDQRIKREIARIYTSPLIQ